MMITIMEWYKKNNYENLTTDTNIVETISSSQEVNKSYSSFNATNESNTTSNINYSNSSNYNNQSSSDNSNFF